MSDYQTGRGAFIPQSTPMDTGFSTSSNTNFVSGECTFKPYPVSKPKIENRSNPEQTYFLSVKSSGDGRFYTDITINRCRTIKALLDTGASTSISLAEIDAIHAGIDTKLLKFDSLRYGINRSAPLAYAESVLNTINIGAYVLNDTQCYIAPKGHHEDYALIGMNILKRFDMSISNDHMKLVKRY